MLSLTGSFSIDDLDSSYGRYKDIDAPVIKSNIPNFIDSVPEEYKTLNVDPKTLFLANVDYIVGISPWNIEDSYKLYKKLYTNISEEDIDAVHAYRRLRLLDGKEYADDKTQSNLILNFDYNPNTFYVSIKKFIRTKSDILISVVYNIKAPVTINFLYILANVSSYIKLFRPYMVTGLDNTYVVIAYARKDSENKLTKDLLNTQKPKVQYMVENISEKFITFVKENNDYIDKSRGWLLIIPGYPVPA